MAHRKHRNHRNSLAGEEGFKCPAEIKEITERTSQARMGVKRYARSDTGLVLIDFKEWSSLSVYVNKFQNSDI